MSPEEIIDYWHQPETQKCWFNSTPEFDQELADKFSGQWERAATGEFDDWKNTAEGCLALCILLDQIPRNIFRKSAQAYATDEIAVSVCKHAIDSGLNEELSTEMSRFLYMPLMHSENLDDQDLCIKMFAGAGLEEQSEYAHHHRDIVAQFGRFPHRNVMLGRQSTAVEKEYLDDDKAFRG